MYICSELYFYCVIFLFFVEHADTKKLLEWVIHKRINNKHKKNEDIEKIKESIIHKYKNKIMKKNKIRNLQKLSTDQSKEENKKSNNSQKNEAEIILSSKQIIGYVSSGGHVLSKGYGYGVAHISFYLFLHNLLNHLFALKLCKILIIKKKKKNVLYVSTNLNIMKGFIRYYYFNVIYNFFFFFLNFIVTQQEININVNGKEFVFLGLMRNVNSAYYHHGMFK